MKKIALGVLLALLILVTYTTLDRNEVGKVIKFGSSLPLSGINKELGLAVKEGAATYFKYTNDKNILRGRKIEFITYDDKYEPELTVENLHKLLDKDKVFALFGFVGTPTIKAIMPIITESDIPFVAPFSGASFLRNPPRENFINFRSSYADEIEKIIEYLVDKKGLKKIAIFYQNDDYGDDGYIATIKSLKKRHLSVIAEGTYRRNTLSVTQALYDIKSSDPQAIIMVGAYKPVALFIKRYREMEKTKTIFCNISFVNADELVKEVGYDTKNMVFSQTVPSYDDTNIPIVDEYRKMLKKDFPTAKYGFVSLESYIAAKLDIEALKELKNDIDRKNFLNKLNQLSNEYKKRGIFGKVFLFKYKNSKFIEIKSDK
ncbi:MAG: ABC transporter substrate-binding protein [Epsilonproteobacteria bacterium]|nr:ABC transporter substrate-binding protein [Campylobacterota bacterium]